MNVVPECSSVCCVCTWYGEGQRKMVDLPGLELQQVVSCHVGAGTLTWVLWKSSQWSKPLSHLLASLFYFSYIFRSD